MSIKFRLFTIISLFIVSYFSFADDNLLVEFVGTCKNNQAINLSNDKPYDVSFIIYFEDQIGAFIFKEKSNISNSSIFDENAILEETDLYSLRNICDKFLEWNDVALKNHVKIKKEIPNSSLSIKLVDNFSSEIIENINFFFFSQSESTHHLLITSDRNPSTLNNSNLLRLVNSPFNEDIYIGPKNVYAIRNAISNDNIRTFYNNYKSNKSKESLFK